MEDKAHMISKAEWTGAWQFFCPITGKLPKEPVCIQGTLAHIFEKSALNQLLHYDDNSGQNPQVRCELTKKRTKAKVISPPHAILHVLEILHQQPVECLTAWESAFKIWASGEAAAKEPSLVKTKPMSMDQVKQLIVEYQVEWGLRASNALLELALKATQPQLKKYLNNWIENLIPSCNSQTALLRQTTVPADVANALANILETRDWSDKTSETINALYSAITNVRVH